MQQTDETVAPIIEVHIGSKVITGSGADAVLRTMKQSDPNRYDLTDEAYKVSLAVKYGLNWIKIISETAAEFLQELKNLGVISAIYEQPNLFAKDQT